MGLAAGMLAPADAKSLSLDITPESVKPWQTASMEDTASIEDGTLLLRSGARVRIPVDPPFVLNEDMVLELELSVRQLPEEPWSPPPPPPGPELPSPAAVEFGGVRIENQPSMTATPAYEPPQPPEVIEDMRVLYFESQGSLRELPEAELGESFRKMRIPLGEMAADINSVNFHNRNSYREVEIRNIRVYDVTSRGDTRPLRPLSEASDASLSVDGIPVTRSSNTIDDLLAGVTIELKDTTSEPVTLEVTEDAENVKNAIITFVGYYNQVRTDIDVLTRREESVVEDAYFETEEQRSEARERLGALFGDSTLAMMRNTLSRLVMSPYRTSAEQELALLAQLGISTGSSNAVTAIDRTRLRGYLDINEEKLDAALQELGPSVAELFGSDTDGDLVVDSGVAFEVDRYLRGYVGTGGIVSQRLTSLDTRITRKTSQIERENTRLEDEERRLKKEFAEMEGALQALEDSSRRLESLNQRNE
jgi:flagellar hook-associated protein 2